MIWESYLWKVELKAHRNILQSAKVDSDEDVYFNVEKALFYSAFVVRKLLENKKLTDAVSGRLIGVDVFNARPDRSNRLSVQAGGFFELGEEFDDIPKNSVQMKLGDVASEIVHSFAMIWVVSEQRNLLGIIISSYKNHKRRAVHVSFESWVSILNEIIADEVTKVVVKVDPSTGAVTQTNS